MGSTTSKSNRAATSALNAKALTVSLLQGSRSAVNVAWTARGIVLTARVALPGRKFSLTASLLIRLVLMHLLHLLWGGTRRAINCGQVASRLVHVQIIAHEAMNGEEKEGPKVRNWSIIVAWSKQMWIWNVDGVCGLTFCRRPDWLGDELAVFGSGTYIFSI